MVRVKNINRDILKWARETSGVNLDDISQVKGLKDIASWEEGTSYPTYGQLETLSSKYKRPLAIFFFPSIPEEDNIKKSFRTIPDYEKENIPPSVRFLLREGEVMQMNLMELYNGKNPYKDQLITQKIKNKDLNTLVNEVRNYFEIDISEQKKWKDSKTALKKWRDILANKGIFVFKRPFKTKSYSGFCLYNELFPIIYINNSSSDTRQIFTLFHELAHLLYKNNHLDIFSFKEISSEYIDNLSENERRVERLCNKFASEFLVPRNDFAEEMTSYSSNNILQSASKLATIYNVSREVILRKFYDAQQISSKKYEEYVKEINELKKKAPKGSGGGNHYTNVIHYLGKPYLDIVFSKYLNNKISIQQTADYLLVKVGHIEQLESKFLGYA